MTPRPLILDVDTDVDDALAILYAVASPEVDLRAVTCTNGNVPLDLVVREVGGCFLHDPLAVAAAIDPSLVTTASCHVEVELEGRHTRGETVADFQQMWRHPLNAGNGLGEAADNLRAAILVEEDTFERRFVARLRSLVEAGA